MTSPLQSAIYALGAKVLESGDYAVPLGERWYLACGDDLIEYVASDRRSRAFISATWKPLPSWWSPEHREALRCACGQTDAIGAGIACTRCDLESQSVLVTASLETGEEIPA